MAFLQNVHAEKQNQLVVHEQTDASEFVENENNSEFISGQQYPVCGTLLCRYCLGVDLWSMVADGHGGSRKALIMVRSSDCGADDIEDAILVNRKTNNTQDYSGAIMKIVFALLIFMLFVIFIVPKLFN